MTDVKDCSRCGHTFQVTDSRTAEIGPLIAVRRKRVCPNCGTSFFTMEIPESLTKTREFEDLMLAQMETPR